MTSSAVGAPRKKKMQLAIEEEELRSLRIPSSAHRGNLSPSKMSYLPTLQEHAQDRGMGTRASGAALPGGGVAAAKPASKKGSDNAEAFSLRREVTKDDTDMLHITAEHLEASKADFNAAGGFLDRHEFLRAMLRNLSAPGAASDDSEVAGRMKIGDPRSAAAILELFSSVDVHSEGFVSWDEVSNYLVEQGMTTGEQFTVDSIKTYEPNTTVDLSKQHESAVEKLVYLEQIDAIVCMNRQNRSFRLYAPKRMGPPREVAGHRGTVINCCYADGMQQVATCASDLTICTWDSVSLNLRNRIPTKDVQLTLQWDPVSRSIFSGSIDGTLSCWDMQHMCLAEARRNAHKGAINDLLMIQDMNLMASASSDGSILMWDTSTLRAKRTFRGHRKGTFSLAYSMDYRCLLTAGLDQEALVWNPYVERVPIFRLKGHTNALCGVSVVPGTPQIISADVKGTFRLWDMRNFRCVQTFGGGPEAQHSDLNTFCTVPHHRQLAAGGSHLAMYDYSEWDGENVTDIGGITDALYNPHAGEVYTVSKRSVKAWNAGSGALFKVLRDIAGDEVTAACLAENGRKIYLGDARGGVAAHGLNNGKQLSVFEGHGKDISCLSVWPGTNKLFSSSWDGVVKVHSDEGTRPPQVKAEFLHHSDGVTCLACSPELMLLATGGSDTQVMLYDLKTVKLEHSLGKMDHVVAGLDFLGSRCMLAVADQGGYISLWRVRPHARRWQRVHVLRNAQVQLGPEPGELRLQERGPLTPLSAVRFCAPAERAPPARGPRHVPEGAAWQSPAGLVLFSADMAGGLRCWDLEPLFSARGIVECDVRALFEQSNYALAVAATQAHLVPQSAREPRELPELSLPTGPLVGSGPASAREPRSLALQPLAPGAGSGDAARRPSVGSQTAALEAPPPADAAAAADFGFLTDVPSAASLPAGPALQLQHADAAAAGQAAAAGGPAGDELVASPPQVTTVRTPPPALSAFSLTEAHVDSEPGFVAADEEVPLLFAVDGHEDTVLKLHGTSSPGALLTCGQDRRVCMWNFGLQCLGVLLRNEDNTYEFPFNPMVVERAKLAEAKEALKQITPWRVAQPELPAISPTPRRPNDILEQLATGLPRPKAKQSLEAQWKLTVERVIDNPDAGDEDYQALFEQMQLLCYGTGGEAAALKPQNTRVLRDAGLRNVERMPQRVAAMSSEEAAAADRFAKAMADVGADDMGCYTTMAKAIRPRPRRYADILFR